MGQATLTFEIVDDKEFFVPLSTVTRYFGEVMLLLGKKFVNKGCKIYWD